MRNGCIAAVINRGTGPNTNANFCKVNTDSIRSANSVIRHPCNFARIHTAGLCMIANKMTYRIIDEPGYPSCP